MRYILSQVLLVLVLVSCGTPTKQNKSIIGEEPTTTTEIIEPEIPKSSIPKDAVFGNYKGDLKPFYAMVDKVATKNGITYISFQNNKYPKISIQNTYGGTLTSLQLNGFDRDVLLFTAALKDQDFNKYFLFALREEQWKPVINGFAIHKSNRPDTLQILKTNPENPQEILRYYSVFDLDETSKEGYTWRLLQESVAKLPW